MTRHATTLIATLAILAAWTSVRALTAKEPDSTAVAAFYVPTPHVGKPAGTTAGGHAPFKPLAGWLDSADPQDVDTEIDVAHNAGIDAFMVDFDSGYARNALDNGFYKARNKPGMKVALSVGAGNASNFLATVDAAIACDFRHGCYWRRGYGPVLAVRGVESLPQAWGGDTNTWRVIAEARRRVRAAGLGEVYLHGQGKVTSEAVRTLRTLGFDAICAAVDTQAMPPAFERELLEAKDSAKRPETGGIVAINAWNDCTNGRWMLPNIRESDQMLRCVAHVFGRRPADKIAFCPMRRWWDKNAKNEKAATIDAPTLENVKYGPHMRQGMDVWLPAGASAKIPCVVEIHGGGWMDGDRLSAWQPNLLKRCRQSGCALAAITYRMIPDGRTEGVKPPVKVCLDDAVAAIRFIQGHADEWNIDPARIGLTGGSAGACSSLYASLQNDNALGIRAVRPCYPQTSLDPKETKEWIPNATYGAHAFGYPGFAEWLAHREECLPWIERFSPMALLRRCTPARAPMFFIYYNDLPPAGELPKDPTHAGIFGVKFAEACAGKGVFCERGSVSESLDRFIEALCR